MPKRGRLLNTLSVMMAAWVKLMNCYNRAKAQTLEKGNLFVMQKSLLRQRDALCFEKTLYLCETTYLEQFQASTDNYHQSLNDPLLDGMLKPDMRVFYVN